MSKITYNDFINNSASLIKKGVKNFSEMRNTWKKYQDEIIDLFSWSTIQIRYACKDTDTKRLHIVTDILKDTYIIDDDFYVLVNDIKKKYKKKNTESYAWWKNIVAKTIDLDDEIKSKLKKRTNLYKEERDKEYQFILKSLQEELQKIENVLLQLHGNNRNKIKIQQWYDNLKNELDRYELDYNERLENYDKTVKKFDNNFYSCVKNYIFSTKNSEKNLKESYIKLFLWEKLQYVIKFTQWNEYQFSLGEMWNSIIKDTSKDIFNNLIMKYERQFSQPKYKQPKLKFDE